MAGVLINKASTKTKLRQSHTERNVNMDGGAACASNVEGPRYANMDGSAASVSNVEGPRYANMDGGAARVSNVEGPRYANMDDSAAGEAMWRVLDMRTWAYPQHV